MKKFCVIGAVIFFVTVPFLLAQHLTNSRESSNLLFNSDILNNSFGFKNLKQVQSDNVFFKITDSTKSDSNITVIKKDSVKKVNAFRMKKSPLVATLLSMALPGAGQLYNQSYWKVPIIAGLVGYFGYEYFHYNSIYKDYRDQYAASQQQFPPEGNDNLKALREFYRNQRDDFVWYFLIVYVINIADAYVDAHLFDFDVKEEKFRGIIDHKAELNVHVRF